MPLHYGTFVWYRHACVCASSETLSLNSFTNDPSPSAHLWLDLALEVTGKRPSNSVYINEMITMFIPHLPSLKKYGHSYDDCFASIRPHCLSSQSVLRTILSCALRSYSSHHHVSALYHVPLHSREPCHFTKLPFKTVVIPWYKSNFVTK